MCLHWYIAREADRFSFFTCKWGAIRNPLKMYAFSPRSRCLPPQRTTWSLTGTHSVLHIVFDWTLIGTSAEPKAQQPKENVCFICYFVLFRCFLTITSLGIPPGWVWFFRMPCKPRPPRAGGAQKILHVFLTSLYMDIYSLNCEWVSDAEKLHPHKMCRIFCVFFLSLCICMLI